MLDIIKYKIANIVTDDEDKGVIKDKLKSIMADIDRYKEENKPLSEIHSIFRTLEEYSNMYKMETSKYMAIPVEHYIDRTFQAQEIMCILSLILSLINDVLRKYNDPVEEKGSLAKYLRMLNTNREFYQGEKMAWSVNMKAQTAVVTDYTVKTKLRSKQSLSVKEVDD